MMHYSHENPRAILFDLDDTIVAFDAVSREVWGEICAEFSGEACCETGLLMDAMLKSSRWYWSDPGRHKFGRNNQTAARREIVARAFTTLGLSIDNELSMRLADTYSKRRLEAMYLFRGSVDTLEHFRSKGVKLALVTNGEASLQRQKIARFKLGPLFDSILIEGELGYGKPEERVYREAMSSCGARAEECWIVGDNLEWEIEIPRELGLYTVWNDVRGKGLPQECDIIPHRIVRSIAELHQ